MKQRHAVALAFAGWYLITPPSTLPPDVSYKAPLRKWHIVRSFDTATWSRGAVHVRDVLRSSSSGALERLDQPAGDDLYLSSYR